MTAYYDLAKTLALSGSIDTIEKVLINTHQHGLREAKAIVDGWLEQWGSFSPEHITAASDAVKDISENIDTRISTLQSEHKEGNGE